MTEKLKNSFGTVSNIELLDYVISTKLGKIEKGATKASDISDLVELLKMRGKYTL